MKPLPTLLAATLLTAVTAQGAMFYSGTDPLRSDNANINLAIPDGNPTGVTSGITTSGLGLVFSGVTITINVSGGFNGDLYAYLSYGGHSSVLLNRIGQTGGNPFGSATAGFTSFTFSDTGTAGIHSITGTAGSPLTGTYQPDGANLNTSFTGNPNGKWTLYFADMATGGGNSSPTLVNWSLDITAVPEPINVALGVFGVVFAGMAAGRRLGSLIRRSSRFS